MGLSIPTGIQQLVERRSKYNNKYVTFGRTSDRKLGAKLTPWFRLLVVVFANNSIIPYKNFGSAYLGKATSSAVCRASD